ncbi:MAG: alpha/beta fold hydrolase [Phycisphaerales bacterium]|nr:alpha/beta fold hydrolase [Phycisphaerales bacterium]
MIARLLAASLSISAAAQEVAPPSASEAAPSIGAKIIPAASAGDGVEVTIPGPVGVMLAGTFVVPTIASESKPLPAVVFITGSGLQDRDETIFGHKPFRLLAAALAERGIASVRCDDRGCGSSTGNPSAATTFDFLEDAKAQIAWLRSRGEIDPARVGVIGHSEGGLIGVLMAQAPDPAMNFAVLLAPPGIIGAEVLLRQSGDIYAQMGVAPGDAAYALECHREMLDAVMSNADAATLTPVMRKLVEAQLTALMKTKPSDALIDSSVKQGMAQVSSPWIKSFLPLDPLPAIQRIGVPMLVLFGERDLQVSPKHNLPPFESGGQMSPVKPEIMVIAGVNHLFQPARTGMPDEYATIKVTMDPSVPKLIAEWIVKTAKLLTQAKNPAPPAVPASPASSP